MSRALKTLGVDAAYALGEEAFRAGFKAGGKHYGPMPVNQPETRQDGALAEQQAWDDYEPSEAVKDLIHG